MAAVRLKTCSKCGATGTPGCFPKAGHWCKRCLSAYARQYYSKNADRIKESQRGRHSLVRDIIESRLMSSESARVAELYAMEADGLLTAKETSFVRSCYRQAKKELWPKIVSMLGDESTDEDEDGPAGIDEVFTDKKLCSVCHEAKPASAFTKNENGKDGLRSMCKSCRARSVRLQRKLVENGCD